MNIKIIIFFSTPLRPECSVCSYPLTPHVPVMYKPWLMEKAAIAHYRKAGGFAKIYINDDGLQVNRTSKNTGKKITPHTLEMHTVRIN